MLRFFTLHNLPWILLWIGLAFLIVTLGVMIRTSWGQSHPLRKCAGLSLLAHLLLLCYATTVEIVTATGGYTHNISVTLVDGAEEGSDDPAAVADDSADPPGVGVVDGKDPPAEAREQPSLPPPLLSAPTAEAIPPAPPLADLPANAEPEKPVADAKPEEKPSEAAPAEDHDASVAKLPEPPDTSADSQWQSGDANTESAPTDTKKSAAASQPMVEVASAPVASRGIPEVYSDRFATDRAELVRRRGGSAESEAAVQAALAWLAANQSADGRWDADRFGAGRETAALGQNRQGAGARADTAMTGLALLAFMGAGNTHKQGPYAKNVQRGLEFLIASQGKDGNLAGESETYAYMYCHGMATFALCEAYAMSGDKRLEGPAKAAINYTLGGQIKATGGWRYRQIESPGEQGDTSQLGWQWMSLKSAEMADIDVPPAAREGVARFLGIVSSGASGGKASYRLGERPTRTMTAEALVCREFLGMPRENPAAEEAANFVLEELPGAGKINMYYWYYATLGMYQLQGPKWDRWNQAMQNTLVPKQRTDGEAAGSWDPECIWGGYGGRVYSTAMSALCLEVYYRYLPVYRSSQVRSRSSAQSVSRRLIMRV